MHLAPSMSERRELYPIRFSHSCRQELMSATECSCTPGVGEASHSCEDRRPGNEASENTAVRKKVQGLGMRLYSCPNLIPRFSLGNETSYMYMCSRRKN